MLSPASQVLNINNFLALIGDKKQTPVPAERWC